MRIIRIAFLNFTGNRENWGCKATSEGLIADIEEALSPDFQIEWRLVPYVRKPLVDRLAERFVSGKLHQELTEPDSAPVEIAKWAPRMHGADAVRMIHSSDFAIFSAEGSLMDRRFSDGTRMLLLPAYAARVARKPLITLNQSVFARTAEFIEELRGIYRLASWNTVREPASLEFAREHNLGDFELMADAAFRTAPDSRCGRDFLDRSISRPYVCISSSGALRRADEHPYFETAVKWAASRGWDVVSLTWRQRDNDRISKGWPSICFPTDGATYAQISSVLRDAEVVMGGRYHMALLAATGGTPSIDLPSGTHKTVGLQQLLGTNAGIVNFDDQAGLLNRLNAFQWDRENRANMIQRVEQIRANRALMIPKLRQAILGALA